MILGGGAAGFAAAEKLRRDGYDKSLVMVSQDDARPIDRPNLSKDYLAGNAPEEWMPLRPDEFYADNGIDLKLNAEAVAIDRAKKEVRFADGAALGYDKLLLAMGAEPVKLTLPGSDPKRLKTLRTLADCRAIIGHSMAPNEWRWWAQASSAWKWRRPCVPAISKSMSSRRRKSPWPRCWGRKWAASSARCMKNMA